MSNFTMASPTQDQVGVGRDQPSPAEATEPPSLLYSTSCVAYMFLGKKVSDAGDSSTIWVRMTRADLDSVYTFRQALTQYIQSATDLGMTHYYPCLGDIIIFPIPFPLLQGVHHRRRLILRTEPLSDGQMYSLLPEDCDPDFPTSPAAQDLVRGSPLESPCRQAQHLRLEGYDTSEQIWTENFEVIKRLSEVAARGELPPGLSPFTLVVGMDPNAVGNTGRGAWAARRLGPLLTKEYLEFAGRAVARASSGATMNGWH